MKAKQETNQIIEHFFRHEHGRISSLLLSKFGTNHIDIIEDAVQDALLKAMTIWPFRGIPKNPGAWILTVSKNNVIDNLRRTSLNESNHVGISDISTEQIDDEIIHDNTLKTMFACCHPSIPQEYQIILVLKIISGFNTSEAARALLKKEDTVSKAYTRAKKQFRQQVSSIDNISIKSINDRLLLILRLLYIIFNEGYNSIDPDQLIRKDLCNEAIRLAKLLLLIPNIQQSTIHALLAMMYHHSSRFDSRITADGKIIILEEQNPNEWNKKFIKTGNYHFSLANQTDTISEYHIEAAIASIHANTLDHSKTNWEAILDLYEMLTRIKPHKVVQLNRIVAYSKVHGEIAALKELKKIDSDSKTYYSIKAYLNEKIGDKLQSQDYYKQALSKTKNKSEINFFTEKINSLS